MTLALAMIEKLLIVDDHTPTREWLRSLLSKLVRHIFESSDGAEAVRAYTEQRPDWVLMDIEMKPMDGFEATRQITARFPDARIIIITSHDRQSFRAAARQAGACGFVTKENLWKVRQIIEVNSPS